MRSSAFWGQSFVSELARISQQGEKKSRFRRQSHTDSTDTSESFKGLTI